jgi:hypothetical protein
MTLAKEPRVGAKQIGGMMADLPAGWADRSTVCASPAPAKASGKPSINLVVKRRPMPKKGNIATLTDYLGFMQRAFGALAGVQTKEIRVGASVGLAVRFNAAASGTKFSQTTVLYEFAGEEISATVTQLEGDPTPPDAVEALLTSIRPITTQPKLW